MTPPDLAVVGIGEEGLDSLGPRARTLVGAAAVLVGGARHLAFLGDDPREHLPWASPLAATLDRLDRLRGRPVVVLASGDPLWFGVASLLRRRFPDRALEVVPAVAAVQLACARLGWAVEELTVVSLHGRPAACLHRHLRRGQHLLLLTDGAQAPASIAAAAVAAGFSAAPLTVLERLGGPAERVREGTAAEPPAPPHDPLNLVALDLCANGLPPGLSTCPGLPDDAFANDGQLTKRAVRAATLAVLAPQDGERLWDVGAGSGSVAIEWLRAGRRMAAIAVERRPERAARASANAAALGVPELVVETGAAPACLAALPDPEAIFLGGGVGTPGLLEACWTRLGSGGRLVANAVTLDGEAALLAFQARHGGELARFSHATAQRVGNHLAWRPAMPVTQLAVVMR